MVRRCIFWIRDISESVVTIDLPHPVQIYWPKLKFPANSRPSSIF
jgi:hypothetical protein